MAIGGWDVHNRSKDDRKQSEENRKSDCASTQSLIHAKRLRRKNYASTAVTRRTASRNWSSDLSILAYFAETRARQRGDGRTFQQRVGKLFTRLIFRSVHPSVDATV